MIKKNTSILIFYIVISFLFINIQPAYAWLNGYQFRKTITINNNNIDSNLSNFPIYIPINSDSDIGTNIQDTVNYYDIRFTDTSDTVLPYEQEYMSISNNTATSTYWVKTNLDSTASTTLYIYYGKSSGTDGSSPTNVWDSGYKGVWHLSEGDSTTTNFYKDSTANNNDGTLTDIDGDVSAIEGKAGKGLQFTGDNDRINAGNDSSLDIGSTFTLSGWINLTAYDSSGYSFLISKDNYPNGGSYDLGLKTNKPYTAINTNPTGSSWGTYTLDNTLPTNEWHYFSSVRNSDNSLDFYLDGTLAKSFSSVNTPAVSTMDVTLGLRSVDNLNLNGRLDELRIENVARNADWIKFTHANMNSSNNEITFGSQEEADITNPTVSTLSPADNTTGVSLDTNFIITFDEAVDTENGNITIYKTSDNSAIETIDVTSGLITGSGTTEITINPTSNLDYETEYYIMIDTTAFDDSSSNSYAGITASTTWSFTTKNTPSCPTISNAATYNAYPTCGVSTCDTGYNLKDGACQTNGGGGYTPPPSIGNGILDFNIDMGKTKGGYAINTKGKNFLTYIDSKIGFTIDNLSKQFTAKIEDLNMLNQRIKLILSPGHTTISLSPKETTNIDLDQNGTQDINIKYNELKINRIDLTFTKLKNQPTITQGIKENKIPPITNKNNYKFTRNLKIGMSGKDIKELQKYLNNHGLTLASSGELGSSGYETEFFGRATKNALIKFQNKYYDQILKPAQLATGTGYFGPLTMKFINNFNNQKIVTAKKYLTPVQTTQIFLPFANGLKIGMHNNDVKKLQKLLSTLPDIYPEKLITGYFGILTKNAVQKFQLKYKIVKDNTDIGYGYVGPMTRKKLNQIGY